MTCLACCVFLHFCVFVKFLNLIWNNSKSTVCSGSRATTTRTLTCRQLSHQCVFLTGEEDHPHRSVRADLCSVLVLLCSSSLLDFFHLLLNWRSRLKMDAKTVSVLILSFCCFICGKFSPCPSAAAFAEDVQSVWENPRWPENSCTTEVFQNQRKLRRNVLRRTVSDQSGTKFRKWFGKLTWRSFCQIYLPRGGWRMFAGALVVWTGQNFSKILHCFEVTCMKDKKNGKFSILGKKL